MVPFFLFVAIFVMDRSFCQLMCLPELERIATTDHIIWNGMEWIGRRFYLFTIRLFLTLFQKEIRNSMRPPKNKKYAKGNISVGDGNTIKFLFNFTLFFYRG